MSLEHEKFMKMALDEASKAEAEDNQPYGAVLVKDMRVISSGYNMSVSELDVTSHGETMALRRAGPVLGSLDLSGCTLYTTYEPCMMCAGAVAVSGVSTLVMGGNYNPHYGYGSSGGYSVEEAFELAGYSHIQVVRGVLVEQCEEIAWRYRAKHAKD